MKEKNPKLKEEISRDRNLQVCLWFAEFKTPQEVSALVKEKYGVEYSRQSAWQFSKGKKYSKIIRYLKRKFLTELSAIPIANKAVRIKYLQSIYHEAMTESLKSMNQWGEVYELKLSSAVEAIKAVREELEPHKATEVKVGVNIENKVGSNGTFTGEDRELADRYLGVFRSKFQK
jgi:hypothetical protein